MWGGVGWGGQVWGASTDHETSSPLQALPHPICIQSPPWACQISTQWVCPWKRCSAALSVPSLPPPTSFPIMGDSDSEPECDALFSIDCGCFSPAHAHIRVPCSQRYVLCRNTADLPRCVLPPLSAAPLLPSRLALTANLVHYATSYWRQLGPLCHLLLASKPQFIMPLPLFEMAQNM